LLPIADAYFHAHARTPWRFRRARLHFVARYCFDYHFSFPLPSFQPIFRLISPTPSLPAIFVYRFDAAYDFSAADAITPPRHAFSFFDYLPPRFRPSPSPIAAFFSTFSPPPDFIFIIFHFISFADAYYADFSSFFFDFTLIRCMPFSPLISFFAIFALFSLR